ncbi:MAG: hypothetical protein JZU65_22605 [Chlorobium sp.]|nr:hypothetical protein [Chlorobium sp.]
MSEIRIPDEIIIRKLPKNDGKRLGKNCIKIETFKSTQFSHRYSPLRNSRFSPKPPLHSEARRRFWDERCRVRVDGKWIGDVKYTLFYRSEIIERYL